MKVIGLCAVLMMCAACGHSTSHQKKSWAGSPVTQKTSQLLTAEKQSDAIGQSILQQGRKMAIDTKEIVRGSCWDYIDTVFNRAGYPQKKRQKVHTGKKSSGPYAKPAQIRSGDWLYYINHSYNGVEHSGIFVRWVDKSKKIGLILSYGGERRNKPGRYREYDLSNVYTIIRGKE